jgi:hypothetical protein
MPGLAQSADGLHPTEDLFHPFALDLTDGVTQMASGATVDGAVNFARDVWSDLIRAQFAHQLFGVTPFRWTVLGCGKKLLDDKFSRSQWAIGSRWPNGGDVGYTTLR